MIKIICVGKMKEKELYILVNDYQKRISKYHSLEIIELKEDTKEKETENILKYIKPRDYIVACDRLGKKCSSIEFANKLDKLFLTNSNITFIIGSSEGISEKIINMSNEQISFSDMTFTHGMFRLFLIEQIYRSFKILNNEKYHK